MMVRLRSEIALLGLIGLIGGSEWLVTRAIDLPRFEALAVRFTLSTLVLTGICLIKRTSLPTPKTAIAATITGITFLALPALLTGWASERISPGLLVVILAMTPLIAALFEGRASGTLLAPLIGGVGGTALLAAQGLSFSPTQWSGAVSALAAAVLVAGSIVFMKAEIAPRTALTLAAIQCAVAALCLGLASVGKQEWIAIAWSWKLSALEATLSILGSALALPVFWRLLGPMESYELLSSYWLATLAGVAEGLVLLGEAPSWRMVVGAAILLASAGSVLNRPVPEDPALKIA